MSTRAYIVLALIVIVIGLGIVFAEVQRAAKTAELLEDLDHDSPDVAVDTMADLVERGSSIEGELAGLLSGSTRRKERMRAAVLLGRVGTPENAGPPLADSVTDDDEWPPVRRAAVIAIGQIGYLDGAPALLEIVKDEDQEMDTRSEAVKALGLLRMRGLGDAEATLAVRPLVDILNARPAVLAVDEEEEEEVADEEEEEAEEVDEDAVVEDPPIAVEAAPADKEIEIRRQCVLTLGLIGDASSDGLTALFASADDTVEPAALVRQYACVAIEDLPAVPEDARLKREMAATLLGALDDADADTRMFACRACANHSTISKDDVDPEINEKLAVMAAELIEEGELYYWGRIAAQTACNSRGVSISELNTSHETAG